MWRSSGGIPDHTDSNILPTSRATGQKLWKHAYSHAHSTSINYNYVLPLGEGRKHYLILVHHTGEGTLVVVHSWKAIYVPHTTGIAESIDLMVRRETQGL